MRTTGRPRKNDLLVAAVNKLRDEGKTIKEACAEVGMTVANYQSCYRARHGGFMREQVDLSVIRRTVTAPEGMIRIPMKVFRQMGMTGKTFDIRLIFDGKSILIIPDAPRRGLSDSPPPADASAPSEE